MWLPRATAPHDRRAPAPVPCADAVAPTTTAARHAISTGAFRDYLRAYGDAAEEYRELKIAFAERSAAAYAYRKSAFVSRTLRQMASSPPPGQLWPTPGVEPSEN